MHIYLDIETIAAPDDANVPEDLLKIDSRLKDPDKIVAAKQAALEKTSLDGAFGEIVSIAWAVDDGDIEWATRNGEVSELELLRDFFALLSISLNAARANADTQSYAHKWVGHNIAFDLGFLYKRCAVHKISPTVHFPWPVNPWDRFICDTNYMWAGRDYVKLDTLAYVLLGKRKTASGADVAGMWAAGEYEKIAEYNAEDVRITREVHKRLMAVEAA